MKKQYRKYFYSLLIFLMISLVSGCFVSSTNENSTPYKDSETPILPSKTKTATPSPTFYPTKTIIPTLTISKTLTITPTPTNTFSPTRTPSWTPVSKLSKDEAQDVILDLYADNGGCVEWPCWWGIIPGRTTWAETHELLAPLGKLIFGSKSKNGVVLYQGEFIVPEHISSYGYLWPTIWIDNGTVKAIGNGANGFSSSLDYSLSGLLLEFGVPEEIWLSIELQSQKQPFYYIELLYTKLGIRLSSIAGNAYVRNDTVAICPQEFSSNSQVFFGILLWDPDERIQFTEIKDKLLDGLTSWTSDGFVRLIDLTNNFDNIDFYNTYIDHHTDRCIDIPLSSLP